MLVAGLLQHFWRAFRRQSSVFPIMGVPSLPENLAFELSEGILMELAPIIPGRGGRGK